MTKCCIRGCEFEGFGNNPWPVVNDEDARCCDECNYDKVISARLLLLMEKYNGTEQSEQR